MKTKNSKVIVFLLVFALLITTVIVTSVANAKTTDIQITADKTEIKVGESATISVKVTTDYPVATMSIPVFYDKTLVDVSDATAVLTGYLVAETTTDSQSVDTAKVYANTKIDSNKFGFVLATYIAAANADVAETIDTVVLTFKITAKADVSGNAAIKIVEESAKTNTNVDGMLYFGASTSGKTITEVPENVENINLDDAISNIVVTSGEATLVTNQEKTGFIDKANNYIYGIPAGTSAEELTEYFTAVNGTFELVANEGGYKNGTGATLVVKNSSGNKVAEYTLIIFGDVDGDGGVTPTDSATVKVATIGGVIVGDANNKAADVDGDGGVTPTDSATVKVATIGGEITVNPYK